MKQQFVVEIEDPGVITEECLRAWLDPAKAEFKGPINVFKLTVEDTLSTKVDAACRNK